MIDQVSTAPEALTAFRNEPYADFSLTSTRKAMEQALDEVRARFGREYELLLGDARLKTEEKLVSRNPSYPSQIVGLHQKATPALAGMAVESAFSFFPEWSRTPVKKRAEALLRAAGLIRKRKLEFDAWLVHEAGKTWPEAEADVSEAIDFCEYYARGILEYAAPKPMFHLPGEHDELVYVPLGAGVIISPWNFPLAILTGMTAAALVAGNTVVIKPSSDTPTIAAQFATVLAEAGFPEKAFCLLTGSGGSVGDVLVQHPKTRFISFTGSREVGLRINELAAKPRPGQIWIKRVIAEMGGKDAIIVDEDAD
ncbi:MAG: aldehyde dehydrogenase family protein, partial [Bryobacteraceae bacterium]